MAPKEPAYPMIPNVAAKGNGKWFDDFVGVSDKEEGGGREENKKFSSFVCSW